MNAKCEHIMFSSNNYLETATLSSNVESVTPLANLKNHYRGRQVKFSDLSNDYIQITAELSEAQFINYFAIAGHNLPNNARVLFQLYSTTVPTPESVVYSSKWDVVGEITPIGLYRVGIDRWASSDNKPLNNNITHFMDELIEAKSIIITIEHNYNFIPPNEPAPVYISDETYRQDETSRTLCIECENGELIPNGSDTWESQPDASASGGVRRYKNGVAFYWSANEGPKIRFTFNATVSGAYKLWLRVKSDDGNSIYSTFDNIQSTHGWWNGELVGQGWIWDDIRQINLIAGQTHVLELNARDHYMSVDKIVIQPTAHGEPIGFGPNESGFGTTIQSGYAGAVTSLDHVSLRMAMAGVTIQLEENISLGSAISFLDAPNLKTTMNGFSESVRPQNEVKQLTLDLEMMTDTDRAIMRRIEHNSKGKPFLVSPYPSAAGSFRSDYIFPAIFIDKLDFTHFRQNIHQTQLNLLGV